MYRGNECGCGGLVVIWSESTHMRWWDWSRQVLSTTQKYMYFYIKFQCFSDEYSGPYSGWWSRIECTSDWNLAQVDVIHRNILGGSLHYISCTNDGVFCHFFITHSPITLANLSSINLVSIFRCSSPPRNLVYGRRVDPSSLSFSLSSHRHSYTSFV